MPTTFTDHLVLHDPLEIRANEICRDLSRFLREDTSLHHSSTQPHVGLHVINCVIDLPDWRMDIRDYRIKISDKEDREEAIKEEMTELVNLIKERQPEVIDWEYTKRMAA